MPEKFTIHVFYPDGESPASGDQSLEELSDRWMGVCTDLLERHGPVMNRNLGSTLSHFDIEMGGPVGKLLAFGHTCFRFGITLGLDSEQDRATASHFEQLLAEVAAKCGTELAEDVVALVRQASSRPTLLLFDACPPEVPDEQRAALMQLGFHLAGAYLQYSETAAASS